MFLTLKIPARLNFVVLCIGALNARDLPVEGRELKTTQLYFEGDPHIEGDPFVEDDLIFPLAEDASGGLSGTFDFAVEV